MNTHGPSYLGHRFPAETVVPELTKAALFEAMRNRHVYATSE